MRYLIIGLGIYGSNLALDLTAQGHEVIGADISRNTIDSIKDYIATAYVLDTTEEASLGVLPIHNVDLVILAIGENFGASVKTVALLKKSGVKKIYARAIDPLHLSILQSFNIDHILQPEQRAALDLTHEMALGNDVETLKVDENNYILKFKVPQYFVGLEYADIDFAQQYGLKIVSISRPAEKTNFLGLKSKQLMPLDVSAPGTTVAADDQWVVFGSLKAFRSLYKRIE